MTRQTKCSSALVAGLALLLAPAVIRADDKPPANTENRAGNKPTTTNPVNNPTPNPTPSRAAETPPTTPAPGRGGDTPPAPAATAGVPAEAEILSKLHHSNQMEIEAGKLAQEKGESKAVKDYGKMLVRDHTAADKKVMSLAKQLKLELTAPTEMKHEKLEKARTLTGAEFDKHFTEMMVDDHKNDVEEAAEARDKTTNPKLKKLLNEVVPKLEKHRQSAEKLAEAAEKK